MSYHVKVIEDSVNHYDNRLQTFQVRYPRYIHAELLTHRVFSRNASSSRAIPVAKLAALALEEMVEPIRWGKNQPGMQASLECLEGEALERARAIWRRMAETCAAGAQELALLGLHKQWANRPLEWFSDINVIVTSTEWANWDELRYHEDAQPEIRHLAGLMIEARDGSTPVVRGGNPFNAADWHLPYVTAEERAKHATMPRYLAQLSAARCARVSYLTHDGQVPTPAKDLDLYQRLVGSAPLHASPIEHQAHPDRQVRELGATPWAFPALHGNFRGWCQHRKLVERETIRHAKESA